MENAITYVGIDAHKKDLFVAMLVGDYLFARRRFWGRPEPGYVNSSPADSTGR